MKILKFPKLGRLLALMAFGALAVAGQAQTYTNFTTIDEPLAVTNIANDGTYVEGISGNVVVGYYVNTLGIHGFYHTLGTTNYTTLDDSATFSTNGSTFAYGISGNNIVGYYNSTNDSGTYGYIYNISAGTYTTLDDSAGVEGGVSSTEAYGIDGNNIIGYFVYNGPGDSTFGFLTTVGAPGTFASFVAPIPYQINANSTNYIVTPFGISGNNVVGRATGTDYYSHGFVYNLNTSSLTLLTDPANGGFIWPYGIDGTNVVGYFSDPNNNYNDDGFLCSLGSTNFTALRDPSATGYTIAQGISGNAIVGYYYGTGTVTHGFVVGTPASSTPPRPGICAVILSGGSFTFNVTNGVPGAHCSILGTANLALPLNQWTVVSTNFFDANGNLTFIQTLNLTALQTFFTIQEAP